MVACEGWKVITITHGYWLAESLTQSVLLSLGRNRGLSCDKLYEMKTMTAHCPQPFTSSVPAFRNFILTLSFSICRICLRKNDHKRALLYRENFIHILCSAQVLACSNTSIQRPLAVQRVRATHAELNNVWSLLHVSFMISSSGENSLSWTEC